MLLLLKTMMGIFTCTSPEHPPLHLGHSMSSDNLCIRKGFSSCGDHVWRGLQLTVLGTPLSINIGPAPLEDRNPRIRSGHPGSGKRSLSFGNLDLISPLHGTNIWEDTLWFLFHRQKVQVNYSFSPRELLGVPGRRITNPSQCMQFPIQIYIRIEEFIVPPSCQHCSFRAAERCISRSLSIPISKAFRRWWRSI